MQYCGFISTSAFLLSLALLAGFAKADATVNFVPAPTASKASSQYDDTYAVANLFDGSITATDIGTANNVGSQYASNGDTNSDFTPVVWMDYGASKKAGGFVYSQRSGGDPDLDKVSEIKFWFFAEDPKSGTTAPTGAPEEDVKLTDTTDQNLTKYDFKTPHEGQFVVMQLIGSKGNPGGSEFRLIAP